jgi:acyl dehydratase
MLYFEDLNIGQKISIGPISVSEEEIIEFAKKFDPQPFHVDAMKAKDSLFGSLCASGWHTCSLHMKMLYDGLLVNLASLGSPGMNEIRWIKPLFPNDTITGELNIISKTPSRSKPSIGSMIMDSKVFNKKKELIMTMQSISIVKTRIVS